MADPATRFLTNDPLTRKKWARELFSVILPAVEFNSIVGTGSDSVVQMKKELGKGEGDEITFGIRLPLTGEGIVGDNTVEGNEEKLRFRNFKCRVEELNHAVDTGGKMEEQRVPYNLMQEGKDALQEWWASKLSDYLINLIFGNSNYKIAGADFAQAIDAPSTDRKIIIDGVATEAALTSSNTISLGFLDKLKQKAEIPTADGQYKIRPIMIGGKAHYRVFMHNYTFEELRQNTNVGEWGDLLRAANKLQLPETEIVYNGMIISKTERAPLIVDAGNNDKSGVYRVALCGAQAAVWAWGGAGDSKSTTMSFTPYTRDADRYVMIRGGGIWGARKVKFEGHDFGIVTGSVWSAPVSA
jgi:N4-gp56 family major capsid protein